MKIGIVGGSISGLSAAVLLQRAGHEVSVLERSEHPLSDRGAGIIMPEELIQACIDLDLFDANISRIPVASRSFTTKEGKPIFEQSLSAMGLNWAEIYSNLRKRVSDSAYLKGELVQEIRQSEQECIVTSTTGRQFTFDYLIGADGIHSAVREKMFSEVEPTYSGYVAWRGTINLSDVTELNIPENHIPYYVFPNGHMLLYRIPSHQNLKDGGILVNWLMYQVCPNESLAKLLTDTLGKLHSVSLPPGSLSGQHISQLEDLAKEVLPKSIATLVCETSTPFLQAIYDVQVPACVNNRICLIGDAAAVLRPHTASGVVKALKDSISLAKAFSIKEIPNLSMALSQWNVQQINLIQQQVLLSTSIGKALVSDTPDWNEMTPQLMQEWWKGVITGKTTWYATVTSNSPTMIHQFTATQSGPIGKDTEVSANKEKIVLKV